MIISKVNFEGKGRKITKTKKKTEKQQKGFEKKFLLTIFKVNFEGKGGKKSKTKKTNGKKTTNEKGSKNVFF